MIRTDRVHVGLEDASFEQRFDKACFKPGRFDTWNLPSAAQKDDLVLIYVQAPVSSLIGFCFVDSDKQPTPEGADPRFKNKTWFHVRDAQEFPNGPATLKSLKTRFLPEWRYLFHPGVACFPNRTTSQDQLDELLEFLSISVLLCGEDEAAEGLRNEMRVMAQKRNRPLRNKVLRAAKGVCEACETDYSQLLDGIGIRVLQVHHRKQLALNDVPVITKASDLAVVCANCHALIHHDPKNALKVETLRKMLAT
jgi:hypothetical protein